MANPRHLNRAPIREAVIDIQFSPPVALDTVKLMTERLKNEFPKSGEIWQASVGFRLGVDGSNDETSTEKNVVGIRYDTNEYVLQCQVDRFTFSRLAPYESWEEMSGVARRLWQEFISVTTPGTVTRVATRYINALPLPLPTTRGLLIRGGVHRFVHCILR